MDGLERIAEDRSKDSSIKEPIIFTSSFLDQQLIRSQLRQLLSFRLCFLLFLLSPSISFTSTQRVASGRLFPLLPSHFKTHSFIKMFSKLVALAFVPGLAVANVLTSLPVTASEGALKFQPLMDWDTDTCYQTAAIGADGTVNPGLSWSSDVRECRSEDRLLHSNTYSREKCNNYWCAYMYGYYSEMDYVTRLFGASGHDNDWEHVIVWTLHDEVMFVSWSAHGNCETLPIFTQLLGIITDSNQMTLNIIPRLGLREPALSLLVTTAMSILLPFAGPMKTTRTLRMHLENGSPPPLSPSRRWILSFVKSS
jgi:hypothetical protein